ncbi:MAG: TonB-dependent receptor, partial [Steroidobacteraceae bacterium]
VDRLVAAVGIGIVSLPQIAAADSVGGLEEVIVTAQKREQSINDIGMSIDAISGEDLVQRGLKDVKDLAQMVPGLTYAPTSLGTPVYAIRGVGFYDASLSANPAVVVYTDEVPLAYPSMTRAAALDVKRVEVLKGPQGTLFGGNTTGGAINFIAARPTETFEAGATLSYGRFGLFDFQGFAGGPVTETLKLRVAGRTEQGGAWQKNVAAPFNEHGDQDRIQGRLLLDWAPSEKVKVSLNVNGWSDQSDTQIPQNMEAAPLNPALTPEQTAFYESQPITAGDPRHAAWPQGTAKEGIPDHFRLDDSFRMVALRGDFELNDTLTLTSLSAYEKLKVDNLSSGDGVPINDADYHTVGDIKTYFQEFRLTGEAGRTRYIIGANYEKDRVDDVYHADITFGSSALASGVTGASQEILNKRKTLATFANVEFAASDTVSLHAGARYTDSKQDNRNCLRGFEDNGALAGLVSFLSATFSPTPGVATAEDCVTLSETFVPLTEPFELSLDEDNVSWRAGVDWRATPDALFYANVTRGYKAGQIPALSATSIVQYEPAKQEELMAYETGFKLSALDRKLQLDGALYYYDYKHKQIRGSISDAVFGPIESEISVPKGRITGAELDITSRPIEGLLLHAGASYTDSEVRGDFSNFDITGAFVSFEGQRFPLTPLWTANGSAEYSWPTAGSMRAFVGAGFSYHSSSYAALGEVPQQKIDAYTIFDARIGIGPEDGRWQASLWGMNLTNKYYWNNATKLNDFYIRFAAMPRTYGVRLTYNW